MKPTLLLLLPILLPALGLPGFAAEEIDREKDKEALRHLRGVYEQAIVTRNLSELKACLADDFSGVMITADEIHGFEGVQDYWQKVEGYLGKDGNYRVTLEPEETIFEGDLAIAKGHAHEHVERHGRPFDFTSQWTAVARKRDGVWKLVRIQGTIDPLYNPLGASLNRFKNLIAAAGALVVGGFFGWLIGRRKGRP